MKTATFFQNRSTSEIARDLLGHKLTYQGLGGYIVETEAYLGVKDRAAHSYGGHRSPANEGLYCRAGSLYIYAQRQYFFFDIATQKAGEPQGVLVRAIEPAQGQEQMEINRHGKKGVLLTNGPAKLMQALGINSRRWDCHFLEDSPFAIDLNHKRPVPKFWQRRGSALSKMILTGRRKNCVSMSLATPTFLTLKNGTGKKIMAGLDKRVLIF